jgi:hypothetical protein
MKKQVAHIGAADQITPMRLQLCERYRIHHFNGKLRCGGGA